MPLIGRGIVVDDVHVSRALYGDDKIQAALIEVRGIAARISELSTTIRQARFEADPPDNEAVRAAVRELHTLSERLRNVSEDLRLFTQVQPER